MPFYRGGFCIGAKLWAQPLERQIQTVAGRHAPYRPGPSVAEAAKARATARANADAAFLIGLIIGAAIEDSRRHGGGDCDSDGWNC
jgi:hypothetical protein